MPAIRTAITAYLNLYIRNFKFYNKNNEYGMVFALIAVTFLIAWGMFVGIIVLISGEAVTFGWWAALPILFATLTVSHFLVRPIVSARYYGNQ